MFDRVQLMGGSTKCYSIEDEPVVCLRRGRDGRAGPPGAIRLFVGPQVFIVDPVANFLWVRRAGERKEQNVVRTRRRGGDGGMRRKEIRHVPPVPPVLRLCSVPKLVPRFGADPASSRSVTLQAGALDESPRRIAFQCRGKGRAAWEMSNVQLVY